MGTLLSFFRTARSKDLYIALTAPALGFLAIKLIARLTFAVNFSGVFPKAFIYRAPAQQDVSRTGHDENAPYPSDILPGGRNVSTPYGNIRAYEWGPIKGRKVLLIHGISTPCIALARMADRLVDAGCRVLLFDLFGRGYSDAPDPNIYRQDINLFSSQVLAVIATSELAWTGGFTMCGYSLGGGIAAEFTFYFPDLVDSLVLIAPGGVLRTNRMTLHSKLLYSGLLPDFLVHSLIKVKIRASSTTTKPHHPSRSKDGKISATDAASEELPQSNSAHASDSNSPIFDDRPHISSANAVAWQVDRHPGFIPTFVSCVKYAPIHDGHERWGVIGRRCADVRKAVESGTHVTGLQEGKVLVLLGDRDVVISSYETGIDAQAAFGAGNVDVVRVSGGHDLPVTNSGVCVNIMLEFWKEKPLV